MTRILEQCNGTIKDGLCMKCFNRAATSSSICTQMYEVEDKKAPVEAEEILDKHGAGIYNWNDSYVFKDGSNTREAALKAMQEYAHQECQQVREKAIQEIVDLLKDLNKGPLFYINASVIDRVQKLKNT